MNSKIMMIFSLLTIAFSVGLVNAQLQNGAQSGVPLTIVAGSGQTATTTTSTISINNLANINFALYATDGTTVYQRLNITLYDAVSGSALNSSQVSFATPLFSPTSLANMELSDNSNLDVMINGLNMNSLNGTTAQNAPNIIVAKVNPQISNVVVFKAYRVELPSNFSYNTILLTIRLGDTSGVDYNNVTVYRCGTFDQNSGVCTDSTGWVAQAATPDQAHQLIQLNINHFSVYAVGSGSSSTSSTQTTTTTTQTQTQTSSSTSTYTPPQSNNNLVQASSSGSSGGGGGVGLISKTTTTTQTPTTTTSVLIVRRNSSETSSTSKTNQAPALTGLLGLNNQISPLLIAAIIIVGSVAALPWIKNNYDISRLKFWEKSYRTFPSYKKPRKARKNTELKLSL